MSSFFAVTIVQHPFSPSVLYWKRWRNPGNILYVTQAVRLHLSQLPFVSLQHLLPSESGFNQSIRPIRKYLRKETSETPSANTSMNFTLWKVPFFLRLLILGYFVKEIPCVMNHLVSTHFQLRGDVPWGLEPGAAISCRDNNELNLTRTGHQF